MFVGGVSVARDTSASYVALGHSVLINPWSVQTLDINHYLYMIIFIMIYNVLKFLSYNYVFGMYMMFNYNVGAIMKCSFTFSSFQG